MGPRSKQMDSSKLVTRLTLAGKHIWGRPMTFEAYALTSVATLFGAPSSTTKSAHSSRVLSFRVLVQLEVAYNLE